MSDKLKTTTSVFVLILVGRGGAPYIKKAIDKYGSKNFVSVILLAGIDKQDELDLAESAAIRYLDCLLGNRGYNKLDGRGESMFV